MVKHSGGGAEATAPLTVGSYADTSAFVTKKGSLNIKSVTFADAGIYTCLGE
jgi:hypothetical protein